MHLVQHIDRDRNLYNSKIRNLRKKYLSKMKSLIFMMFVGSAAASGNFLKSEEKTGLDMNQKVYIENQPVLGDGAGENALNQCRYFSPQFVANPDAPAVKVCGTGIKATFYLRGECEQYFEH